jgi:hypothetical protein
MVLILHALQRHILLPHVGDALIERRNGFEWETDELADRAVQILKESLTLSGK